VKTRASASSGDFLELPANTHAPITAANRRLANRILFLWRGTTGLEFGAGIYF
jgi:hypothetical protein